MHTEYTNFLVAPMWQHAPSQCAHELPDKYVDVLQRRPPGSISNSDLPRVCKAQTVQSDVALFSSTGHLGNLPIICRFLQRRPCGQCFMMASVIRHAATSQVTLPLVSHSLGF